jgi:serine/threonine protein kinase
MHFREGSLYPMRPGLACNDGLSRLDPYMVIARLGASWVGEVWRVRNQQTNGEYALKVLPTAFTRNDEAWEKFGRRTRWLTEINHPHIVAPFDVVRNRRPTPRSRCLLESSMW